MVMRNRTDLLKLLWQEEVRKRVELRSKAVIYIYPPRRFGKSESSPSLLKEYRKLAAAVEGAGFVDLGEV